MAKELPQKYMQKNGKAVAAQRRGDAWGKKKRLKEVGSKQCTGLCNQNKNKLLNNKRYFPCFILICIIHF